MKEIGTVASIEGSKAKVIIERSAMCGDCGACQVGKDKLTMETDVVNTARADIGDRVEVEMAFTKVMKASIIVYGIPLACFIIGAVLTALITGEVENPLMSFFVGLIFMLVAFIVIKVLDQKGVFSNTYEPQITTILNQTDHDN